jgi:hypothetical protein
VPESAENFLDCVAGAKLHATTNQEKSLSRTRPAQAMAGVQLRVATEHTGEQYVTRRAWRDASLERCPVHPEGGCGLKSHGTYERKRPAGVLVRRWYCPKAGTTFSLLPDWVASRYPAALDEIENVVAQAEQAPSQAKAIEQLWPELGLVGAQRKLRRWRRAVTLTLTLARGLLPELQGGTSTLAAVRERLGTDEVLVNLREKLVTRLHALPAPVGFGPRPRGRLPRRSEQQHEPGPDPPR